MQLRKIYSDLYDISSRLKEIDEGYELFFNPPKNRFEVHSAFGLEVVVPYRQLDARTLTHVRKTRISNRQKIVDEIERENRKAEEQKRKEIIDMALSASEDLLCK